MFVENYISESEIVVEARIAVIGLGTDPVSPGTGAALRMSVVIVGTRAVLEVGIGTGVSDLWPLDGMPADGVLASIDFETEFHQQARRVSAAAGALARRICFIVGRASDVLPRVTAHDYDMVVLDADIAETLEYLDRVVCILRPGGMIVFVHMLWHDQAADPVRRDGETVMCRGVIRFFADSPGFTPAILPVGNGLTVAAKRQDASISSTGEHPEGRGGRPDGLIVGAPVSQYMSERFRTVALSAKTSPETLFGVSSMTSRPPPSFGTHITIPRPSFVVPKGPSPALDFIAAICRFLSQFM